MAEVKPARSDHGRLLKELVEKDPLFKDFRVVEFTESESGNKLTLVLVKKDVPATGSLGHPE